MTMKRWILWLLVLALVISELLLFSANKQKAAAQAEAHDAHQQLEQLQADLAQGKTATAEDLKAEIARLRSENQDLLRLRNQVRQLSDANLDLTQQLREARQTMRQQQAQLQQWDSALTEAQRAQQAAAAAAARRAAQEAAQQAQTDAAQRTACISNLRRIDAAKQQWALEHNKTDVDVPAAADLLPYFKDGIFPSCPAGGLYSINAVGLPPTCSIQGHALPPQ